MADDTGGFTVISKPDDGGFKKTFDPLASVRAVAPNVRVTSGYRTPQHNAAVGGAPHSDHLRPGGAYDLVAPGMSTRQLEEKIRHAGIPTKQILDEHNHVHWAPGDMTGGFTKIDPTGGFQKVDDGGFKVVAKSKAQPAPPPKKEDSYIQQEFESGVAAPLRDLWKAATGPQKFGDLNPLDNPIIKAGMSIAGAPFHALIQRPLAEGISRLPIQAYGGPGYKKKLNQQETEKALEGDIGIAAFALGRGKGELPKLNFPPLKEAAGAFQKILAPATVSKTAETTAGIIRGSRGEHQLMADQAGHTLMKAQKAAGNLSKEDNHAIIAHIEGNPHTPDEATHRPATGKGARLMEKIWADRNANTPMKKAADVLRTTYRHYRTRAEYVIAKNVGAAPKFIEDYYTHLWADKPDKVISTMGDWSRQGSGRNFRKRAIPTYADGLAAGLTPKYENPFEATAHYTQNMSRFLTTHDVQGQLKDLDIGDRKAAYWAPEGRPKHEGDVRLNGIMTERVPRGPKGGRPPKAQGKASLGGPNAEPADALRLEASKPVGEVLHDEPQTPRLEGPDKNLPADPRAPRPTGPARLEDAASKARRVKDPGPKLLEGPKAPKPPVGDRRPVKQVLYAHPDAARIYNNFISKGLEGTQAGPFFHTMRALNNGAIMLKLGLSAFHATFMAKDGMISELARGYTQASRGNFKEAGKAVLRTPVAPLLQYARGNRMTKALLNAGNPAEISDPILKAFYKSGQQLRMDDFYRTRGAGSFWQSFARGSFKKDFTAAVSRIFGGNPDMLDRAKGAIDITANAIQSVSAPLFEHIIPRLKQGVFAGEMRDFIEANPGATEAEITAHARKIGDSVDNRMGELTQDNLFWHRWMKQLAQITMTSFSWNLGDIREIGGGLKDIPESARGIMSGKGITPRTAYVAALATFVPLQNAIYQYLKTGKAPQGMDFLAPQTGGQTQAGNPERAAFPGYEKDVYGLTLNPQGPGQEISNKKGPLAGTISDYASDKDYRGDPIVRPWGVDRQEGEPSRFEEIASDLAQRLVPITLTNRAKLGSNISGAERAFGMRPSPSYIEDRDRSFANTQKYGRMAMKKRTKHEAKDKAELDPSGQ